MTEQLRTLLERLDNEPSVEINPSNYCHDDVCNLNNGYVEYALGVREALGLLSQPAAVDADAVEDAADTHWDAHKFDDRYEAHREGFRAGAALPALSQRPAYTPFQAGDTHCSDCPCRYGQHINPFRLNQREAADEFLHAMRDLFGSAYQPSRTQAEILLKTVFEKLGIRSLPTAPKQEG